MWLCVWCVWPAVVNHTHAFIVFHLTTHAHAVLLLAWMFFSLGSLTLSHTHSAQFYNHITRCGHLMQLRHFLLLLILSLIVQTNFSPNFSAVHCTSSSLPFYVFDEKLTFMCTSRLLCLRMRAVALLCGTVDKWQAHRQAILCTEGRHFRAIQLIIGRFDIVFYLSLLLSLHLIFFIITTIIITNHY